MALKDWKKTDEGKYEKGHNFLEISYSKKNKNYRVLFGNYKGNRARKIVKTKSQAISFAKNYMRTH